MVSERSSGKDRLGKPTMGDQKNVRGQRVNLYKSQQPSRGRDLALACANESRCQKVKAGWSRGFRANKPINTEARDAFVRIHVVSFTHKGNNMEGRAR